MSLTFNSVKSMSSFDLFNYFVDMFERLYKEYKDLKLSRSDFRIFVTSCLEIGKKELKEDDEIENYFKQYVKKMLDSYNGKKVNSKKKRVKHIAKKEKL